MRLARGPEPRHLIGGFHHLRRVFTHPHLWGRQQRAQCCERPADAPATGGAGDTSGAGDTGAAPACLAPPGPRPPAPGPWAPADPRRADRGTDCDVYCVAGRVRYIVYSECAAVMTSAPFYTARTII